MTDFELLRYHKSLTTYYFMSDVDARDYIHHKTGMSKADLFYRLLFCVDDRKINLLYPMVEAVL